MAMIAPTSKDRSKKPVETVVSGTVVVTPVAGTVVVTPVAGAVVVTPVAGAVVVTGVEDSVVVGVSDPVVVNVDRSSQPTRSKLINKNKSRTEIFPFIKLPPINRMRFEINKIMYNDTL
jgi:hypothetical protein